MKKRMILSIFLCVSLCMTFSSCQQTDKKYSETSFEYFDTVTTVIGYAANQEEFAEICQTILNQLSEYHQLFDIYHTYEGVENLCTVNALTDGIHPTVKVDERIMDMLLFSKEMYEKTEGKINIAMGSVLSVWHKYREAGSKEPQKAELPPMDVLQEAALHTDMNNLILDEENGTVTITDPKMTLDVGAIAKGYAVEMVARSMEESGIFGYILNVGGNVRTIGTKADGTKWTIGIENHMENAENPYLAYLYFSGESVVTSGSYQRNYTVNGQNYHHIIDSETLMPADQYRSVSVICQDSGLGDVLSTALFCMNIEEGMAFAESLENVEVLWVFEDGTQIKSNGFDSYTKK